MTTNSPSFYLMEAYVKERVKMVYIEMRQKA
jgi:hypothetical protein